MHGELQVWHLSWSYLIGLFIDHLLMVERLIIAVRVCTHQQRRQLPHQLPPLRPNFQ